MTIKGKEQKSDRNKADFWLTEDSLFIIKMKCMEGARNKEICDMIGITKNTFYSWRRKYPEFDEAVSKGKEYADFQVENALFSRCIGYKTKKVVTNISEPDIEGNRKTSMIITEEEIPPNVTACLAWLNNRKNDVWKRNRDQYDNINEKDNNLTIQIVKKTDNKEEVEVEYNKEKLNKQSKKEDEKENRWE